MTLWKAQLTTRNFSTKVNLPLILMDSFGLEVYMKVDLPVASLLSSVSVMNLFFENSFTTVVGGNSVTFFCFIVLKSEFPETKNVSFLQEPLWLKQLKSKKTCKNVTY